MVQKLNEILVRLKKIATHVLECWIMDRGPWSPLLSDKNYFFDNVDIIFNLLVIISYLLIKFKIPIGRSFNIMIIILLWSHYLLPRNK